jgi:hypothetical protein
MKSLLNAIMDIANQNKEGFTLYLPSLEFVKHGWVIANAATQNQFGADGLETVLSFALQHNRILGGYCNEDSIFQWDASIVEPNRMLAISLMILHHQDCIYNLSTGEMVWNELKK